MRPAKDDLTHDDAARDLADVLGDYVWSDPRNPESCRDRLAAYIENTETERDNYFAAMNAAHVRFRQEHETMLAVLGSLRNEQSVSEILAEELATAYRAHYGRRWPENRECYDLPLGVNGTNAAKCLDAARTTLRAFERASAYSVPDVRTHAERMRDAESDMCGDDEL